jgi:hypothetical protein
MPTGVHTGRGSIIWERKSAIRIGVAVGLIVFATAIVAWSCIRHGSTPFYRRQQITSNGKLLMSPDPRARRILEQVASRLDRVQELDVVVRSQHLGVHNESSELRSSATTIVRFRRPADAWRLQGKTTQVRPWEPDSGAPYELIAEGKDATLSLSIMNGGRAQPFKGVVPALEALRGITRETANVVPDMLLHEPFEEPRWNRSRKPFLSYLAERARLENEEAFDGYECYRVQSERETGTWTLWIDKQSLLPRGVKRTKDGSQIKSSGLGLAGRITYMESVHQFEVTRVR